MKPENYLVPQPKPTPEQIAYVFAHICENAGGGTFRYLIYDRLGCKPEDYSLLFAAGGLRINNAMGDYLALQMKGKK